MKKLLIVCGLALLSTGAFAQLGDFRIGAGVGVGTTGIDIDVSATYGEYLGARFGVDIMPQIKVKTDINLKLDPKVSSNLSINNLKQYVYGTNGTYDAPAAGSLNAALVAAGYEKVDLRRFPNEQIPNKIDIEGKLTNTTWHLLFDVYPFGARSSFHATVGAYFSPKKIVKVYNQTDAFLQPVVAYNNALAYAQSQTPSYIPNPTNPSTNIPSNISAVVNEYGLKMIGAELGDYFITPDPDDRGNVEATIEVGGFRPYVGIGFGRAVPKKRIGCQFDLGVQFWGTPKVYAPSAIRNADGTFVREADGTLKVERTQLTKENSGGDAGGAIKTISKISVYPVLNFRLVGRIL